MCHSISHGTEQGGFKEIVCKIDGKGAYGQLKFESGAHRVQRVPETEFKVESIPLLVLLQSYQFQNKKMK